jgi:hypothetical protein
VLCRIILLNFSSSSSLHPPAQFCSYLVVVSRCCRKTRRICLFSTIIARHFYGPQQNTTNAFSCIDPWFIQQLNSSIVSEMGNLFILLTFSVSFMILFERDASPQKLGTNLYIDPLTSAAEARRRILIVRKSIMKIVIMGFRLTRTRSRWFLGNFRARRCGGNLMRFGVFRAIWCGENVHPVGKRLKEIQKWSGYLPHQTSTWASSKVWIVHSINDFS